MSQYQGHTTITRDDIKGKLGEIQGGAEEQVRGARNQLVAAGALVALLLLVVAFLLGRRGGRRSSAVIEVRRG